MKFAIALTALCALLAAPSLSSADDSAGSTDLSAAGNAQNGKKVFRQCMACHNVAAKGPNRAGPSLHQIFGRKAGGDTGYSRYSDALKAADFMWTEASLNEFLTDPNSYLPGVQATMRVRKVRDEQDRKDVLAFLRQATAAQ